MWRKRRSRSHMGVQKMERKREEVDEDIAKLDPGKLPAGVKQGIAPAIQANPRHPYLGKQEQEEKKQGSDLYADARV